MLILSGCERRIRTFTEQLVLMFIEFIL